MKKLFDTKYGKAECALVAWPGRPAIFWFRATEGDALTVNGIRYTGVMEFTQEKPGLDCVTFRLTASYMRREHYGSGDEPTASARKLLRETALTCLAAWVTPVVLQEATRDGAQEEHRRAAKDFAEAEDVLAQKKKRAEELWAEYERQEYRLTAALDSETFGVKS